MPSLTSMSDQLILLQYLRNIVYKYMLGLENMVSY